VTRSVSVSPVIESVLREAKQRLVSALGERLREVRLFGSTARGAAREDSDIDLLVVVDPVRDGVDRLDIIDLVAGVAVDHALPIEVVVLGADELDRLRRYETAFARALDAEGIVV
jgi:predicted nucleotidyltransferase